MTEDIYLIFDSFGFVAAKKTDRFSLAARQRGVRLKITIPDAAFEPAGMLQLKAEIPIDFVLRPAIDTNCEALEPEGVQPDA